MGQAEKLWNELRKMSNAHLVNACATLGVTPVSNRNDHLITALMDSGKSITNITAASNVTPVPAVAGNVTPAEIMQAIDRAIAARVPAVAPGLDRKVDTLDAQFNAVRNKTDHCANTINGMASTVAGMKISVKDAFATVDGAIVKVVDQIKSLDEKIEANKAQDVSKDVAAAVAAAFKPIRDAFASAPADVQAKVVQTLVPAERRKIRDVFDLDHDLSLDGDDTCEVVGTPQGFDPDYVFDDGILLHALASLRDGDNFWLYGQRGTGKTQFAHNLAARTGRPFFQVSCHENLESADFIGADGLQPVEGGNTNKTAWEDGIILKAYRTPNAICLIDEATMVRAAWTSELHRILEPKSSFYIARTGELVPRSQGMVFIAADNTNGCGDESGRFTGTKMANSAYVDRFAYSLRMDFMPEAQEIALLVKRGADKKHAKALINVFTRCRAEVGGSLVEPPSLRQAFAFCKAIKFLNDAVKAWETTVVNKSIQESQEPLRQLFSAHWSI